MRIAVLVDRARLFRWHLALAQVLKERGNDVVLRFRDTTDPLPTSLTAILDFDRARGHANADSLSTRMRPDAFMALATHGGAAADVTLDLSTGLAIERQAGPVIRPLYDGSAKDEALFRALLGEAAPRLGIWHSEKPQIFDIGQPAVDAPLPLSVAFDRIVSRTMEGLVRFFSNGPETFRKIEPPPRSKTTAAAEPIEWLAARYGLGRSLRKLRQLTDVLSGDQPRCYTAWRRIAAAAPIANRQLHLAGYRIVDDGGGHAFADPCLFSRHGRTYCFVSKTAMAGGGPEIGCFALAGSDEPVRTVLRAPEGVQRPSVFTRGGEIWMIADHLGLGVDLYRAERFPDAWVLEKRLIGDPIHAPTLISHGGREWIFATSEDFASSGNDGVAVYWADALVGPWQGHARNPVLIDGRSARPAGAFWEEDGALFRTGQDHVRLDGGITVKRIEILTPNAFAEAHAGTITLAPHSLNCQLRTIARSEGYEAIAFRARPSIVRSALRGGYG